MSHTLLEPLRGSCFRTRWNHYDQHQGSKLLIAHETDRGIIPSLDRVSFLQREQPWRVEHWLSTFSGGEQGPISDIRSMVADSANSIHAWSITIGGILSAEIIHLVSFEERMMGDDSCLYVPFAKQLLSKVGMHTDRRCATSLTWFVRTAREPG